MPVEPAFSSSIQTYLFPHINDCQHIPRLIFHFGIICQFFISSDAIDDMLIFIFLMLHILTIFFHRNSRLQWFTIALPDLLQYAAGGSHTATPTYHFLYVGGINGGVWSRWFWYSGPNCIIKINFLLLNNYLLAGFLFYKNFLPYVSKLYFHSILHNVVIV
jgi:hypothetical protein